MLSSRSLVIAGCWVAGCAVGLRAEGPGAKSLPLVVHAVASSPARTVAVCGGIPFPQGELATSNGIRLVDASGDELPVQTAVLATWGPGKKWVRWLLVDLQLTTLRKGENRLTLLYGPDVNASVGPEVSPQSSPWPPQRIIAGLYAIDQHGKRYLAGNDPEPVVQIETSGPLRTVVRAHVWHTSDTGQRFCRAILRLHYYAGVERVRVFHSFVMDADPEEFQVRGLGLKLPVDVKPDANVTVAGEQEQGQTVRAAAPISVLQDSADHYTISSGPNDAETTEVSAGRRSGGWLSIANGTRQTVIFVRNGWEEYPYGLRFDGRELDIQLWPEHASSPIDLRPLPSPTIHYVPEHANRISTGSPNVDVKNEEALRDAIARHPDAPVSFYRFVTKGQTTWSHEDVVPRMERGKQLETELLPGRFAYYYVVFGNDGRNTMKRHEFVLEKLPRNTTDDALAGAAELVRFPPLVTATPQWNCDSGTIGPAIPACTGEDAELDRAITFIDFEDTARVIDEQRLYGAYDFGDYPNANPAMAGALHAVFGAHPQHSIAQRIGWTNIESTDSLIGPWVSFLRTGDPRIFYRAEAQTEHAATVDQYHYFPTPSEHLAVALYHTVNHYDGGKAPSHTINQGMLLGYFITGDPGLREVALANADYFLSEQRRLGAGWYADPQPNRQNLGPLTSVLQAYTLTWDEKYLKSCETFWRAFHPVTLNDDYDIKHPRYSFSGVFFAPVSEFLRLATHKPIEDHYRKVAEDVLLRHPLETSSCDSFPMMVYMWEQTGDPRYLAYIEFCFRWHRHCVQVLGKSDVFRRRVFGYPDLSYGQYAAFLSQGFAALHQARKEKIDLDKALLQLQRDRAKSQGVEIDQALSYWMRYPVVEGLPMRWTPRDLGTAQE